MFNFMDAYFKQSPLIPVVFASLLTIIVLMQCFTKRRFLKIRLLLSFLLTFITALALVFFQEILKSELYLNIYTYGALVVEALVFILIFSSIDFSLANERLQGELTRSLDETKYYVMLDKHDRIKEISKRLVNDLGVERRSCIGKSFFDVLEYKYTIVGLNQVDSNKNDCKKYYENYAKKAREGEVVGVEIDICDDSSNTSAIYFNESAVFSGGRYKGRILLGEIKDEESLMGLEKDLRVASSELDIIKSRFITILNKTSDGIFFNTLSQKSIWFNDNLVKKLSLNGNAISTNDFLSKIHPDDLPLYEDIMTSLKNEDYTITYRYNRGAYYVYVKEEGHKIVIDKTVELCGIMKIIDDYSFEHTDTILDNLANELDLKVKLNSMAKDDMVYEVVSFKVASIPDINKEYGRAIGNMMLGHYISLFKEKFIEGNLLYRIGGLEFVGIITSYSKMQALKNLLNSDEKILHLKADYIGKQIPLDVFMGISLSNDTNSSLDSLKNSGYALRIAENKEFNKSFAYFKEIR